MALSEARVGSVEVGVDGGGGDVDVAEQDLHDAGVDAAFEQSRRIAVALIPNSE